jgi:acyl-CoA synthetase (AMP-forming)/AMP-acid ligase II
MSFNIADLFESLADAIPEREALVSGERRLTFAALDERANRLAHFFAAQGIGAGDHIGLHLYNGNEFVEGMLAAFKLRAVPININYRYVEDELRYLCANADLKAILSESELAPRIRAVAGGVPTLKLLLPTSEYEAALASGAPGRGFAPRSGDDLYIIYTGGTTGMPRGVMWRQEDVFFAGLQGGSPGGPPVEAPEELAAQARDPERGLCILPAAPFIHGAAQWAALIGLFSGGKVVLVPGASFRPAEVWRLVAEERVSTLTLVGDAMARPLAEALSEHPVDTSSLMVVASAGAILSASVKERLQSLLPATMVLNSFGASETGHQGTALPADSEAPRACFFMDETSAVLDEEMRPIAPGSGKVGKLARRGRLPLGYYRDPEKGAATFLTIEGERWVIPGDLATVEADGRITVFGRGAICINSGGEKIFPEEVEEALKSHPAVVDAVVVGVPDERWGERVAAVVQPLPGKLLTLSELDAHCRGHIAGYKVPRALRLVDAVVRHPSGKPDYRWAKSMALTATRGEGCT